MNRNRYRRWAAIGCAALALAACNAAGADTASTEPPGYIDPALIPQFQKTATAACLCARNKSPDGRSSCWRDFDARVARYRHATEASACGPGSTSYVIFARKTPPGGGRSDIRVVIESEAMDESELLMISEIENSDLRVMTEFGYGACSAEEVSAKVAEYERKTGRQGC